MTGLFAIPVVMLLLAWGVLVWLVLLYVLLTRLKRTQKIPSILYVR